MRVRDIIAEPLEIHTDLPRGAIDERVGKVLELVGLRAGRGAAVPARVQRRAAAAHRDRAGARDRHAPDRAGRAGLGARRVGAGSDHQPARGAAAVARRQLSLHRPRPRHGRAHQPPDRGDVPGQDRRDGGQPTRCARARCIPTRKRCSPPRCRRIPTSGRRRKPSPGEVPSALSLPSGCRFHPRCPSVMPICSQIEPTLRPRDGGGEVACHLYQ